MTRAFGGRAFWWVVLVFVLAACGSADEPERLGASQNAINAGQSLVIRQIYPGNGTYSRFLVEVYNRGTASASLNGLLLETSKRMGSYSYWYSYKLPSVWLLPRQSFLVAFAPRAGADLPIVADLYIDNLPLGLSTPGSRWALVKTPGLTCLTNRPCTLDPAEASRVIDLVAFGSATPLPDHTSPSEGTPASYPSATQSLLRKANGNQDTDSNIDDFVLGAPELRNMESLVPAVPVPGAPMLDATTGTTPSGLSSFVYDSTNANAPQTGVAAGTIDPARASWIIGYVKDGSGAANAGVAVTVQGPSGAQYGQATTRADGRFDMVVNGSANFTLRFSKTGFFSADRRVYAGAQLTTSLDDIWLVAADSTSTVLTPSSSSFQVAAGSTIPADATSAARTPVLMIPKQTKFKVGSTDLTTMTLRLTEYTAGANGINRMPASLTGSPAYTYAVEISADGITQSVDFKTAAGADQQAM